MRLNIVCLKIFTNARLDINMGKGAVTAHPPIFKIDYGNKNYKKKFPEIATKNKCNRKIQYLK